MKLKNETEYRATLQRIEELLKLVGNDTPIDDPNLIELDEISDLVADYEDEYYPIE
jgi:HTH-type transcriptional regulator/antitoxin HigA